MTISDDWHITFDEVIDEAWHITFDDVTAQKLPNSKRKTSVNEA